MDEQVLKAMNGVRSAAQVTRATKCEAHIRSATSVLCQSLYAAGVEDALPIAERFAEAQRATVAATFAIIKAVEG